MAEEIREKISPMSPSRCRSLRVVLRIRRKHLGSRHRILGGPCSSVGSFVVGIVLVLRGRPSRRRSFGIVPIGFVLVLLVGCSSWSIGIGSWAPLLLGLRGGP